MIRYKPQEQLRRENEERRFEGQLDANNRWIKLADALPWDEMAKIYMESLCEDDGRPTIDVRLALGALIIKHRLKLSNREVVATIQENVYIQYFVGFTEFQVEAAFDPSLLVSLRERMGAEKFDRMSQLIIRQAQSVERQTKEKPARVKKKKRKRA
jgi:IS5 family transposase